MNPRDQIPDNCGLTQLKDYASMRVLLMNPRMMPMRTEREVQVEKMKKVTALKQTPSKTWMMILIEREIYFSCIAPFLQKAYLGGSKGYSRLHSFSLSLQYMILTTVTRNPLVIPTRGDATVLEF